MAEPIFGYKGFELINGTKLNGLNHFGLIGELQWFHLGDPCPYCFKELIFDPIIVNSMDVTYLSQKISVCVHCGWWLLIERLLQNLEDTNPSISSYFAKLYQFEAQDKSIELEILSSALRHNWDNVKFTHPRKFEELVQDIIKTVYRCEVKLTAFSKDNGIDLYSVICEQPWAFQIKRRSNNAVEGVEGIREFIGAMIQNNVPNGVFITSSPKFTKGAEAFANNKNLQKYGLKMKLINGLEFKEYFKLYYDSKDPLWKTLYKGDSEVIINTINNYKTK